MKLQYVFIIWFVILSIPLSYMMGSHSLSLKPSREDSIKSLVFKEYSKKWNKLHFLGGDCGCSENVYKNLMKRKPANDINEQVFVIGKNDVWLKSLKAKGYVVVSGDMDEFVKKYSINAVPQLSILDDKNNIIYSGGYTSKRGPASAVEDQEIYQELKEKHMTQERPIFGCLNGSLNRKNADPLKIKY
jgi:hypothetical protein